MVCLAVGTYWKALYPWSYVARTLLAGGLLIHFRKRYTPIVWRYWWLGALLGVAGVLQWVGMDTLLQRSLPRWFALNHATAFNPEAHFAAPGAAWGWIAVRLLGAAVVVPFMEELFWRDYLWRRFVSPDDFRRAAVGQWSAVAFLGVAGAFCLVHPQWLTALVWGLMIGALLARTRSLGACIAMHATTNLLLGIYVLTTRQWEWW